MENLLFVSTNTFHVDVINETTGRQVEVKRVSLNGFVRLKAADDEGGRPEGFFGVLLSWYDAITKGVISTIDPLPAGAEYRREKPVAAREAIRRCFDGESRG